MRPQQARCYLVYLGLGTLCTAEVHGTAGDREGRIAQKQAEALMVLSAEQEFTRRVAGGMLGRGWALMAPSALGAVTFPIFILFAAKPRLRNDEVVASLIFTLQDGSTSKLECSAQARVGLIKLEFIPQVYGEIWLAVHYQGELFYEASFSVGPLPCHGAIGMLIGTALICRRDRYAERSGALSIFAFELKGFISFKMQRTRRQMRSVPRM